MTADEFEALKKHIFATFPEMTEWGRKLDGEETVTEEINGQRITRTKPSADTTNRRAISDRWWACLRDEKLADARKAVDELARQTGDPWPYPADKGRAGAIIADKCKQSRQRSTRPPESTELAKPRFVPSGAGSLFGDVLRAIAEDSRHDAECQSHRQRLGRCRQGCPVPGLVAAERIAKDDDGRKWPEPRFHCPHCQDRGVVAVIQPSEIKRIAAGERVTNPRTWAARCSCQMDREGDWLLRFDESVHVADTTPEAELVTKCKAYVECVIEDKRVTAFAGWNESKEF